MIRIAERIRNTLVEGQLLKPGDRIVAAVSGGLDSMALLQLLTGLAPEHRWTVAVAHFNHRLRGRSSGADERFVKAQAKKRGLEFHSGSADVRQFAADRGLSIEMAARQLRHEFLATAAHSIGARNVVLAHHADDQLELFFLRLLRGSGAEGLAGMKPVSRSPADPAIQLVRPLLGCTRRKLEQFVKAEKIPYREDTTNQSLDYYRNRVRHRLLPLLRRAFQPAIHKTILRTAEILGAESEFVAEQTHALQHAVAVDFDTLHRAVQRRWLRSKCLHLGISADFELIEALRSEADREWTIKPGVVAWRDRKGRVQLRCISVPEFTAGEIVLDLSRNPGEAEFGGVRFQWRRSACHGPPPGPAVRAARELNGSERFDARKIGSKIRLRHWRPGDRFQPIGMPSPVKVQDLLINCKIPRARRTQLVLAETAAGEIFWIEGLRISERFKIDASTRNGLGWSWQRQQFEH